MNFKAVIIIFPLLASCTLSSPNFHASKVQGVLLDASTLEPIKKAEVVVKLTDPLELYNIKTDNTGKFVIENEGEYFLLPDLTLDEKDFEVKHRKVRTSFAHTEYIDDLYEEELDLLPVETLKVDVGTFYLEKKEEFSNK